MTLPTLLLTIHLLVSSFTTAFSTPPKPPSLPAAQLLKSGPGPLKGYGHIIVLNSSDWNTASPSQAVGCIDNDGRMINQTANSECGVFSILDEYPYSISSEVGNCTFMDKTTVPNTDSLYGKDSHAWTCNATHVGGAGDAFYSIPGFKYPLLCYLDIDCYFDAKHFPAEGEKVPFWEFLWGSGQMGITPGHVMVQLMWEKVDEGANGMQEVMEL